MLFPRVDVILQTHQLPDKSWVVFIAEPNVNGVCGLVDELGECRIGFLGSKPKNEIVCTIDHAPEFT